MDPEQEEKLERINKEIEIEEKLYKIRVEEIIKVRRQHLRRYYFDWYNDNPEALERDTGCKGIAEYTLKKQYKPSAKIYLVTVNPRPDVDIDALSKKVVKCVKKIWIKEWMYCYEWREGDSGLHVHIRLTLNKKKKLSEVRRECFNTFKTLVEYRQHVNIKFALREDSFIDYVRGIKGGEPKDNHKHDIANRRELRVQDIYISPNSPPLPTT